MSSSNKPVPPTFDAFKKQIEAVIIAKEREIAGKTAEMKERNDVRAQRTIAFEAELTKHSKDPHKAQELRETHEAFLSMHNHALSELDEELEDLKKAKSDLAEQLKGIPDGTSD